MLFSVFVFLRHSHAECGIDILNFLTVESPVNRCLFDVENLSPQRKDSLCLAVTALLCSTARRVSLDEEDFAFFRILL